MKRNLIKNLTAIIMSVILVFSATVPTFATTTDSNIDFSDYIDYDANYTKNDLKNLRIQIEPGSKYTPESVERHTSAYEYAMEVYENPNATQEEINKAYIEFCESELLLEYCNLDEDLANLCYYYTEYLRENYNEYFTEASQNTISECHFSAMMSILFTNTQEDMDKETQDTTEKLRTLELTEENPDIVLWTELEQIDKYMQVYIEENRIPDVDYSYGRIPKFKDFNGYRMVGFYNLAVSPMFNVNRYEGYILETSNIYNPSGYGYLMVNSKTGDIVTLEDAIVSKDIVDVDKLFELYLETPLSFNMHIIGDADCDNQLSVTDATYIQKICAGIEEDSNTLEAGNFNDFNNDRRINIIDATEIQKALVS